MASLAVAAVLTSRLGLRLGDEAVIAGGGVTTFLALAWLTKLGSGRETLTYYHHEVAIFAVAALLAASLHAPILAHLDVTALALGTFLVFGRIGCLRAGCCHGRPWHRGVRYGAEHVEAGFPSYLRDLPLVPVQALESAAVALIVLIGAALFLDPRAPGRAFSFYLVAYAVVRLALEEARGDTARRHLRGLSEAQWTSLALIVATLSAELAGLLPGRGIGLLGAACALAECLAVGLLAAPCHAFARARATRGRRCGALGRGGRVGRGGGATRCHRRPRIYFPHPPLDRESEVSVRESLRVYAHGRHGSPTAT